MPITPAESLELNNGVTMPALEQMAAIDDLDTGRRGGPEPDTITLQTFGRKISEA